MHQRQLFQELALVTRFQHTMKRLNQNSLFSHYLQGQSPLLLCLCLHVWIMQIFVQHANDLSIGNQYNNGVCNTESNTIDSLHWTMTCRAVALSTTVRFPLISLKIWCNFSDFSNFLEKLKLNAYQVIKHGVKWRCCVIFTKYGDKKSAGSSYFGA